MKKDMGMYIHIPFCVRKCKYCDFVSYTCEKSKMDTYVKWLIEELKQVGLGNEEDAKNGIDDKIVVKTIYIGGGTPSIVEPEAIENIMETIRTYFEIDKAAEITIEVNPGTVTKEKLQRYYGAGINRMSIGMQSMQEELLTLLGRIHTKKESLQTYTWARETGFENCNIDIMIGLPTQTLQDVEETVTEILALEPEHISCYSLILEEGTVLEKEIQEGKWLLPEEELERNMYWKVKEMLEKAGYIQYEISNFAKPGKASKHNLDCWNQKEYMGFGVAAHSYTNGVRYSNIDSLETYIANFEKDKWEDNLIFHEKQTIQSMQKEYMLLGFRKLDGISISEFKRKFIENPCYLFRKELHTLSEKGLITIEDEDTIKLTSKGLDLANIVFEEFV